jgi:hypothetical protein
MAEKIFIPGTGFRSMDLLTATEISALIISILEAEGLVAPSHLLMETGDSLLLETGDFLLLG